MYRLMRGVDGKLRDYMVLRVDDNASIPFDLNNRDYRDYLRWLDAGGVPEEEPKHAK